MNKNKFIPTINISSIFEKSSNSKEINKIIKKIENACINVGFFQITGHGISLKKIRNLCKVGENFFKSNFKNKSKLAPKKWNKNNKNIYRGYFPNDVNGKEGLDIGDLRVTKSFSNKINNRYIEYIDLNKSFNKNEIKILSDYFDRIFNLSETLFKCIIIIYKKDPSLSKLVFSRLKTLSTLRFNYYPKQASPVEISKQDGVPLGCETHVDSGIFTILYQDKCGGLQVQNRKNKRWYDVPFNRNALVVNTGRALEFLSKNKFRATNHRVLWNRRERLSVPFFFEPSFDFKMNKDFLTNKRSKQNNVEIYEKFLNKSLKKFIEYQR